MSKTMNPADGSPVLHALLRPTGLSQLSQNAYSLVLPARWYLGTHAKDDPLAKGATDALADELEPRLKALRELAWPALPYVDVGSSRLYGFSTEPDTTVPIEELAGMLLPDAKFATFLEGFGEEGRKAAAEHRAKAKERWSKYQATGDADPLWHLWTPPLPNPVLGYNKGGYKRIQAADANEWTTTAIPFGPKGLDAEEQFFAPEGLLETAPRFIITLTHVVWLDVVRPRRERAQAKALTPVRIPTDMSKVFATARANGGAIVGTSILVEPPSGMALTLPFDGDLKVSRRTGGDMVNLRQVLSPGALRTYLATFMLWEDAGLNDDGSFEIEGPGTILDVTGATRHEERKGAKVYKRFATKDTKAVLEHLSTFTKIRVRVVGDLEAAAGDALLDEISDRRNGRIVTYAHSRMIAARLKKDYVRIPRAVCRLAPADVPIGMGIATIARSKVLALLRDGKAIEAPLERWLEASGIDGAEGSRKHGRVYWGTVAEELVRIAEEGRIGTIGVDGKGREAVLTLKLSPDLRESYAPLLVAAKAQAQAKRVARVADHRKRLK